MKVVALEPPSELIEYAHTVQPVTVLWPGSAASPETWTKGPPSNWTHEPGLTAYLNHRCPCEPKADEPLVPVGPALDGRYLLGECPICGRCYWRSV